MAQGDSSNDLVELAREFLSDASVKGSPRQDKVDFLKEKGLADDVIEKLLVDDVADDGLKTIHDTSEPPADKRKDAVESSTEPETMQAPKSLDIDQHKPEVAPIITYPEFLLKPQKPPPLVTISQLVNATYTLAGASALTWAASRYVIQPMLETLTEARHELADKTLEDLEKLNEKLETMVSHVPYVATSAVKRQQEQEDDVESVDSDPTELFHRDVAVQTTPGLSRSSSALSMMNQPANATSKQTESLTDMSFRLRALLHSMNDANETSSHLQKTAGDLQQYLDTLDSSSYSLSNPYLTSTDNKNSTSNRQTEAQKFKQEIRSLKGAFLSSRNFPTAPRPTATAVLQSLR